MIWNDVVFIFILLMIGDRVDGNDGRDVDFGFREFVRIGSNDRYIMKLCFCDNKFLGFVLDRWGEKNFDVVLNVVGVWGSCFDVVIYGLVLCILLYSS